MGWTGRASIALALATVSACSVVFDPDHLREGSEQSSVAAVGSTATAGAGATTTGAGGDGGGDTAVTTAGTGSSGADGGADPAAGGGSSSATTTGAQGGGGGGGSARSFCATDGADSLHCFDFDGPEPFLGLDLHEEEPTGADVSLEIADDRFTSPPRAAVARVLQHDLGASPASATFNLPSFDEDRFAARFRLLRDAVEDPTVYLTFARLFYREGAFECEILFQTEDNGGASRLRLYRQRRDPSITFEWTALGTHNVEVAHPTTEWTTIEVEVRLDDVGDGTIALVVDGIAADIASSSTCLSSSSPIDLDIGAHYTEHLQALYIDDVVVTRLP